MIKNECFILSCPKLILALRDTWGIGSVTQDYIRG
jgi:hypothetical protein